MLATILGVALLIILLFPQTPCARTLHLYLVELPLLLASSVERRHLFLLLILLCCGQSLALLGSADLAFAYAVDLSIYADAMVAASLAGASVRITAAWRGIKTKTRLIALRLLRPRPRSRRTRGLPNKPAQASNDDDPICLCIAA